MRAALAFLFFSLALLATTAARARTPENNATAAPQASSCAARMTTDLAPLGRYEPQRLVVESYGGCDDAMVAIWIDRTGRRDIPGSVQVLHLARLADFDGRTPDVESAAAAIRSIFDRIETDGARHVETWSALQRAGDQPNGGSWRGTTLSRSEYQRITSSSSRLMLIPTDRGRAKLVAWDDDNEVWVDLIYYGD